MVPRVKKITATIGLLALILTPLAFFSYPPTPVNAEESCAAAYIASLLAPLASALSFSSAGTLIDKKGAATQVAASTAAVPAVAPGEAVQQTGHNLTNTGNNITSSAAAGGQIAISFSTCVLKPLMMTMAQRILANITQSLVTWIQSGFNGNPSFVTNIDDLVSNSANQTIGDYISGTKLSFLCSPFSAQIRIALATSFSGKPYQGCTLTQIDQNINNFANTQQAWSSWLNVSTVPANNEYGAYIQADGILSDALSAQTKKINDEVSRNGGFLDFKICDGLWVVSSGSSYTINSQKLTNETGKDIYVQANTPGATCNHWSTGTPGKLISDAVAGKNAQEFNQLGVADDINQILGALVNEMVSKLNGPGGLLGAKTSSVSSTASLSTTISSTSANDANTINTLNSQVQVGLDQQASSSAAYTNLPSADESTSTAATSSVSFVPTPSGTVVMSKGSSVIGSYSVAIAPIASTTIATPVSATITMTSSSGTALQNEFDGSYYSLTQTVGSQSASIDPSNLLIQSGGIAVSGLSVPATISLNLKPSSSALSGTFNLTIGLADSTGASLGTTTEMFVITP